MYTTALFANPQTQYAEAFTITYGSLTEQIVKIRDLNTSYDDISRNIITHDALKGELVNDTNGLYKDFSGNYLAYSDSKTSVKDAVKEDIHSMILQQNNSYILGMIAISTILITTFLLTRK